MTRNSYLVMIVFTWSVFLAFPSLTRSQETEINPTQIPPTPESYARVSSYQPSFVGWALGEEPRATFQMSMKYPFLPFEALGANTGTAFFGYQSGLYVAYTGRYDFYLQRYSGPTISREHNPGLYFDFNRSFNQPLTLTLGYFHDSNGQVVDTRAQYLAIPDHAQDFVSRGWDYVLAGAGYTWSWLDESDQDRLFRFRQGGTLSKLLNYDPNADQSKLTLSLQGLYFMDKQAFGAAWKEEDIFWEDVSEQPHRSNFDGVRFSLVFQNAHYRLADTLRTGYTAFHLTNDLTFTFRILKWLPLSIQYHTGYGPDLSSYHIYSQHWMLGCEFW